MREISAALTIMYTIAGVAVIGAAIGLCKLAWSRIRGNGERRLSDQWEPDESMRRHKNMSKGRNEP